MGKSGDSGRPRIRSGVSDPLRALTANSRVVQQLVDYARQVAPTPYSVLIDGETGTGKEVFARGIHHASGRSGAFIPINCSAVPEHMFEAELFGARRGAYTGLDSDRDGLFEASSAGTLFLDEVGDLPAATQAKLLRVLDDRVVRPLGSTESHKVDVRIISATHRSLADLVSEGLFREDLFFRLSETHLHLPPIRERPEDLPELIEQALHTACSLQAIGERRLSAEAGDALREYAWPGNIRELNNVIATAVLNSTSHTVRLADLPGRLRARSSPVVCGASVRFDLPFFEALDEFERAYIADVLRRSNGNITEAARLSQLSRGSVRNKARSHGLISGGSRTQAPRTRVRRPNTKRDGDGN